MRLYERRRNWLVSTLPFWAVWLVFVAAWWGPCAARSFEWARGRGHSSTVGDSWAQIGPVRAYLDYGGNYLLMLGCLALVLLEWTLSRHFRGWVICAAVALVGLPSAILSSRMLLDYEAGAGVVVFPVPRTPILVLFVIGCVSGIVVDVLIDRSRPCIAKVFPLLTSVGAGCTMLLVAATFGAWWLLTDDALSWSWRFSLFLLVGQEDRFSVFYLENAPFGRLLLVLLTGGLAIAGTAIVVARLFVGEGIGPRLTGRVLAAVVVAGWISLPFSLPYVQRMGLQHRAKQALPDLGAMASWAEQAATTTAAGGASVPPRFSQYSLATPFAGAPDLPFPCPAQVAYAGGLADGRSRFSLVLHPGYWIEQHPPDSSPSAPDSAEHLGTWDSEPDEAVELQGGWYLTYREGT